MPPHDASSLLLVVPVPARRTDAGILMESQALHALTMYARHFERITLLCPELPPDQAEGFPGRWVALDSVPEAERLTVDTLPWGYDPLRHLRARRAVIRRLDAEIARHSHLQFAMGGMFGDWGALAGARAARAGRRFALWADRVEHRVIAETRNDRLRWRLRNALELPFMKRHEIRAVRRASVCLFNGHETWRYYRRYNPNSHQLHDIHTSAEQFIDEQALQAKTDRQRAGEPLRIFYMGRLSAMKAPLEWLAALQILHLAGVPFHATWLGDGELMGEMVEKRRAWGLEGVVELAGFVADHERVLRDCQAADLMLFTHVTPESPRCLIESLISGTPIVGYRSDYSANLVEQHGGGWLCDMHDVEGLAAGLRRLHEDRAELARLTAQAARNGRRFSDQAAFAERCELILQYAGPTAPSGRPALEHGAAGTG